MRFDALCCFVASLALSSAASAGMYVENVEKEIKSGKITDTQRMWIQGDNLRVESGGSISLLKGETLTIIDPDDKTYWVMDRAAMQAMAARLGGAMAQMESQLAGLPPEQRAMAETMMGSNLPGKKPALKVEAVDLGRTESVGGRSCRLWDLKINGAVRQRHCVVPYAALPGKEDFQALMKKLAAFMEQMREAMPQMEVEMDDAAMEKLNGYPVLTRDFANGKPAGTERRMTEWREEPVPAAQFAVPAGYKLRDPFAHMKREAR